MWVWVRVWVWLWVWASCTMARCRAVLRALQRVQCDNVLSARLRPASACCAVLRCATPCWPIAPSKKSVGRQPVFQKRAVCSVAPRRASPWHGSVLCCAVPCFAMATCRAALRALQPICVLPTCVPQTHAVLRQAPVGLRFETRAAFESCRASEQPQPPRRLSVGGRQVATPAFSHAWPRRHCSGAPLP